MPACPRSLRMKSTCAQAFLNCLGWSKLHCMCRSSAKPVSWSTLRYRSIVLNSNKEYAAHNNGANPHPCRMPEPIWMTWLCWLRWNFMQALSYINIVKMMRSAGAFPYSKDRKSNVRGMRSKALAISRVSCMPRVKEARARVRKGLLRFSAILTLMLIQCATTRSIESRVCLFVRYANCGMLEAASSRKGLSLSAAILASILGIAGNRFIGLRFDGEVGGFPGFGIKTVCVSCHAGGNSNYPVWNRVDQS